MDSKYELSITKINHIINGLSEAEKLRIPGNVINFFDNYSNDELLKTFDGIENKMSSFNDMDKNFLKIIDYYVNGI